MKLQIARHHHIAGYTPRASKKLPLYLLQNYTMVNFITGRSHSLLEKFNLQQSGWREREGKKTQNLGMPFPPSSLDAAIVAAPFKTEIFEKG